MTHYLDFEKPLAEIEGKAEELRALARGDSGMDVSKEAAALDKKARDLLKSLYGNLSAWRKCQVARHPERPNCVDYIDALFAEYTPLAGDRAFGDDHAILGGLASGPTRVEGFLEADDTLASLNAMVRLGAHNILMSPPLVISEAQVDTIIAALDAGFAAA